VSLTAVERRRVPWCEPLGVAGGLVSRDGALALLSDGGPLGRWSWVAAEPDRLFLGSLADGLKRLEDPSWQIQTVGLASYDAGARPATGPRPTRWPDLILARYPAMLVFDHLRREIEIVGRGASADDAVKSADLAASWLTETGPSRYPPPPATDFAEEGASDRYLRAVADVIERISSGELFQANIARAWSGRLKPGCDPFEVLLRLSGRAAAFGAYWRVGDQAIVSNSPELFLSFEPADRRIETRPIKGTRPRQSQPTRDAEAAAELASSPKDRAENLMIVDLMRNDLAQVADPGSVTVERLFQVESHPTVHHLVSTVRATARADVGPSQILSSTFPPGSITGAPKHQAMKVIAHHESARGPWCGTLFHIDEGRLTASVLIRTAEFILDAEGWRWRALAGAGVVADSQPAAELAETEAKIRALRDALVGP
jgi:para-aminobenzoate synthetase component 1